MGGGEATTPRITFSCAPWSVGAIPVRLSVSRSCKAPKTGYHDYYECFRNSLLTSLMQSWILTHSKYVGGENRTWNGPTISPSPPRFRGLPTNARFFYMLNGHRPPECNPSPKMIKMIELGTFLRLHNCFFIFVQHHGDSRMHCGQSGR